MKRWNVVRKGNLFRIAEKTNTGLFFFTENNGTVFWETDNKPDAFRKVYILNNPIPEPTWEIIKE